MTKRKNHSPDFKAKVALEAICEDMTMAELSKKYGVHPTQIDTWKRAAVENMATAFSRRERDFLANASFQLLGKRPSRDLAVGKALPVNGTKNGEPGS